MHSGRAACTVRVHAVPAAPRAAIRGLLVGVAHILGNAARSAPRARLPNRWKYGLFNAPRAPASLATALLSSLSREDGRRSSGAPRHTRLGGEGHGQGVG